MTLLRTRYNRLPFGASDPGGGLSKNFQLLQSALSFPQSASVTAATTLTALTADAALVLGDATSAAFTVTLPSVLGASGITTTVKKTDASGHHVTVAGSGSDLIDGSATYALTTQYQSVTVLCDGTTWWIV